jgi:hypothetical protein
MSELDLIVERINRQAAEAVKTIEEIKQILTDVLKDGKNERTGDKKQ